MKRLLDTNAYVELLKGNVAVADLVRNTERVAFSMVVVGELCSDFEMAIAMSATSPRSTTS